MHKNSIVFVGGSLNNMPHLTGVLTLMTIYSAPRKKKIRALMGRLT